MTRDERILAASRLAAANAPLWQRLDAAADRDRLRLALSVLIPSRGYFCARSQTEAEAEAALRARAKPGSS